MLDKKKFKNEILRMQPKAEKVEVCSFSGYGYITKTPMYEFHTFDLFVNDLGFIHLISRNSFNQDILNQTVSAFERVKIKSYKKDTLYVYSSYELEKFDCIGIAPPDISEIYKDTCPNISKFGYWVYPMFGIEFLPKFSGKQFWQQVRRQDKWRVSIVNWDRLITIDK